MIHRRIQSDGKSGPLWFFNRKRISPPLDRLKLLYDYSLTSLSLGTLRSSFELLYVQYAGNFFRVSDKDRERVFADLRLVEGHHVVLLKNNDMSLLVDSAYREYHSFWKSFIFDLKRVARRISRGRSETDDSSMNT